MAIGEAGANGVDAQPTAVLAIKLGVGLATPLSKLTTAKIALPMDSLIQNLDCATRRAVQVCYCAISIDKRNNINLCKIMHSLICHYNRPNS